MPHLDHAGLHKQRERNGQHHGTRLRHDEQPAPVQRVRPDPRPRSQQEDWQGPQHRHDTKRGRRMSQAPDHPGLRRHLHPGADERDGLSAQVNAQIPVSQGQKAIKKSSCDLWHCNLRSRVHRGVPSSWAGLSLPAGKALAGGTALVAAASRMAWSSRSPYSCFETNAAAPAASRRRRGVASSRRLKITVALSGDALRSAAIKLTPSMCVDSACTRITAGRGNAEEHTSELQSRLHLVCRLLLEKKKKQKKYLVQHI